MLQAMFEILGAVAVASIESTFVRTFSGPVHKLSLQDRRDDPVYKKNLQRLIERNREFREERNEPRS
jgi:hypothetical protein